METVLRSVVIYAVLIIIVRLSGRRTISQMTTFDLVLLLIVAETTQQALLGDDFSLTNAVIAMIALFGIDVALSYLKRWSITADKIIDGRPTMLIEQGIIDQDAFHRARVDMGDVLAAARTERGILFPDQIAFAILEADGRISIIPKQPSTNHSESHDVGIRGPARAN
jgi:uncharacterized membrane protein YcaP (DUF421 family)